MGDQRRPSYRPFRVVPSAFTVRQCARIVELGTVLPADRGELLDQDPGAAVVPVRDSSTRWIPLDDSTAWIRTKLERIVERANRHYGFELTGLVEDLQFTSYDRPGAHYTWHQDGLDGDVANRKLAVVVQLSDPADYTGGELEFIEVAEDYDDEGRAEHAALVGRQGTAVVFPAFEFHRVRPVGSGIRHSLVAWVDGPPFR